MIFEGLNNGLEFTSNSSLQSAAEINNSAFVNNTTYGVEFYGGEGSIDNSTIAGNTYGFYGLNFEVHLEGDTITHNTDGFYSYNGGNTVQAVNTVNADNTAADCSGTVIGADWEAGTFRNEDNLVGSTCPHNPNNNTDIAWDSPASRASRRTVGQPCRSCRLTRPRRMVTPSLCGSLSGTDQREFKVSGTSCDIGSVQTDGTGNPKAGSTPTKGTTIDFGTVPSGQTGQQSVSVFRASGGDLMYGYGSSISGAGFKITGDSCKYYPMSPSSGLNECLRRYQRIGRR